jgi:hypothetical protein
VAKAAYQTLNLLTTQLQTTLVLVGELVTVVQPNTFNMDTPLRLFGNQVLINLQSARQSMTIFVLNLDSWAMILSATVLTKHLVQLELNY